MKFLAFYVCGLDRAQSPHTHLRMPTYAFPLGTLSVTERCQRDLAFYWPPILIFPALSSPPMLKRLRPGKSHPGSKIKQSYSSIYRVILHFRNYQLVLSRCHYLREYFLLSVPSTDRILQTKAYVGCNCNVELLFM